ncbi:MAG: ABC transporter substrate-binding protein [Cyclobacteriaceae bacterium]
MTNSRRKFLINMSAIGAISMLPRCSFVREDKELKLLLNSGISGPQAFFFVASDKGYLNDIGVKMEYAAGSGAAASVPRIIPEGFDFGYGDLNALIDLAAHDPENAPVAIYIVFNQTPLTIAVDADGPIKGPADLTGSTLGGHALDAAFLAFPAFAKRAGIDPNSITFAPNDQSMRNNVEDMLDGKTQGVFGFVNTIIASLATSGINHERRLRFIEYADYTPELFGNALMVSKSLLKEEPEVIKEIVSAFNQGLHDMIADTRSAIESVYNHNNALDREAAHTRLIGTMQIEMGHPDGKRLGIGDADSSRLKDAIALVSETYKLPRTPAPEEIFNRDFLPPMEDRVTSLAVMPYRMLLNSGYSGAQSWFHLATVRGYLREEKINLDFTPGNGAYTCAPRIVPEGFDIGYGDINSLIEVAANSKPGEAPIAVFVMFNSTPSTIAVAKDGPIQSIKDLEGKRLLGHASDVALQIFPAYAEVNNIDASTIKINTSPKSWEENIEQLLSGKQDGLFGYVSTITTAFERSKMDLSKIRFINFNETLTDYYGSALMVSPTFMREKPEVVYGLVKAINIGLIDTIKDPEAGIYASARKDPTMDKVAELKRLKVTFAHEMAHPEARQIGIGDVDDQRLTRAINLLATSKGLPRIPALEEIYTRKFLPPLDERVRELD